MSNYQTFSKAYPTTSSNAVIEVTDMKHKQELVQMGVAVVDIYGTWCAPCKRIEPLFAALASKHPNVTFAKQDVDKQLTLVKGVPTFEVYNDGQLVETIVGDFAKVESMLNNI